MKTSRNLSFLLGLGFLVFVATLGVSPMKTLHSASKGGPTGGKILLHGPSAGASGTVSTGPGAGIWIPTSDWRTHLPPPVSQSLPPLQAPAGVTAVAGQVLTIYGSPLPGVTLQIGNKSVSSDSTGRFLLADLDAGNLKLDIVGSSANHNSQTFGLFEVGIPVEPQVTNVLPFTIWMPVLDTANAIVIPVPTSRETVATNLLTPGLELHIAAGTVIRDVDSNLVRAITLTPVPLDRPPFPLPTGVDVPIYFTLQPGLAHLQTRTGFSSYAWLVFPNRLRRRSVLDSIYGCTMPTKTDGPCMARVP